MLAEAGGSAIKLKLYGFIDWRRYTASNGSSFKLSSDIRADYCYGFGENPISLSDVRRNFQENPAATATSIYQAGQTAVGNKSCAFYVRRQS